MVLYIDKPMRKFSIFNFQFSIRLLNVSSRGYALIELLAVFSILAIVTAVSIASFSSYNSRQVIESSSADVASMLHAARAKAVGQVKPAECSNYALGGYQVGIVYPREYNLNVVCGGNTYLLEKKNLPEKVTFATNSSASVLFNAFSGVVANSATIILSGYNKNQTIQIDKTGNISQTSTVVTAAPTVAQNVTPTSTPTPTRVTVTATPIPATPTPTVTQTCSKNYSCIFILGCYKVTTGGGQYCTSTCNGAC